MPKREAMTVDDVMQWLSDVVEGTTMHEKASYRDRLTAAKLLVDIYDTEYNRTGGDFDNVILYGEEKFLEEVESEVGLQDLTV